MSSRIPLEFVCVRTRNNYDSDRQWSSGIVMILNLHFILLILNTSKVTLSPR